MVLKDKHFDIIQYCTYISSISDVQNFFGCLFCVSPAASTKFSQISLLICYIGI